MKVLCDFNKFRVLMDERGWLFVGQPRVEHAAAVLALFPNGDAVLVEEFRPAVGGWQLNIPRGGAKEGETSLDCARRELLEETGLDLLPGAFTSLGRVHPDNGLLVSRQTLFLAQIPEDLELLPVVGDGDEMLKRSLRVTPGDLLRRVAAGEIRDVFTLSALLLHQILRQPSVS